MIIDLQYFVLFRHFCTLIDEFSKSEANKLWLSSKTSTVLSNINVAKFLISFDYDMFWHYGLYSLTIKKKQALRFSTFRALITSTNFIHLPINIYAVYNFKTIDNQSSFYYEFTLQFAVLSGRWYSVNGSVC